MKRVAKAILSQIPIFLFCVIFVAGYTMIFGSENSTMGVVTLTTMLILLKNDFGFKSSQASISLVFMFLIMVVGAKLSLINPYVGIVVNFVVIMTILILSSYDVEKNNHIPFLLGYIFCQGYDVTGKAFGMRIMGVVIGGILLGGMYFLLTRKKTYDVTLKDIIKAQSIHTHRTQWYLKLTILITLVTFFGDLFNYPRVIWLSFAVLSMAHHEEEERARRLKYRVPATIIAAVVFFVLFEYLIPREARSAVMLMVGFVLNFLSTYFKRTILNSFSALMSSMMLFSTGGAAIIRVVANAIALVVVWAGHKVFDRILPPVKKEEVQTV